MYAGVPSAIPVEVSVSAAPSACSRRWSRDAASALATPKSVTSAIPPVTSTFSGLMSRWTTPFSCAYANALAISRSNRVASVTGISPVLASRARSVSPSTSGMV
jgi:hypothetical protein